MSESDASVKEFAEEYSFGLDDYQRQACEELAKGRGVLVAAPTGAGKTVVGEFAVHQAIAQGRKCFYTTPIKALSNQKYHDLAERWGTERVGLLTGDSSINSEAQVVVMTTEVLRNMIYAASTTLHNLGYVVMDEVHYLADRFRGAVWEEVILGLAPSVQLVSLSATVSNVETFGEWLTTVRGDVAVVVSERRPVPLYQHVLVGNKLLDLFDGVAPTALENPTLRAARVNKELLQISKLEAGRVRDDARRPRGRSGHGKRQHGKGSGAFGAAAHRRFSGRPHSRSAMALTLQRARLLPGICFIFSRAGCDAAVAQVVGAGVRLTSGEEARALGEIADRHVLGLDEQDLDALAFEEFREALMAGVAAHHAGLLPAFKAIVEEGFSTGALKLVFATETLALGINMPARTVVLEKLVKYNGEAHVDLTAGEYTQLTGRAGRRGIDVEGHAVVAWQPGMDPRAVAGLASRRTYPLNSSFTPSYNMAVNLVSSLGRQRAREVLALSFAQFQADKTVVRDTKASQRSAVDRAALEAEIECHLGDAKDYARLLYAIGDLESDGAKARKARRNDAVEAQLSALQPGEIIYLPKHSWCVVLGVGTKPKRGAKPWVQVMAGDHTVLKLSRHDFTDPPESIGRIRVPRRFSLSDRAERRSLLAAMRDKIEHLDPEIPQSDPIPTDEEIAVEVNQLRKQLRMHPVHQCEQRHKHAVAAAELRRLDHDQALRQQAAGRRRSLAHQFDQVCAVLEELNYLDGDTVTQDGMRLRRIYNELDLVAAECIRRDTFAGLNAAELAAVLSSLVYETRPTAAASPARMPTPAAEATQSALREVWREVGAVERSHGRERARQPDIGFAEPVWRWAHGQDLAKVLKLSVLPAGDFVRWVRQVIDVSGQVALAAGPGDLRRTCHEAINAMRRGVVAAEITHE